MSDTNDRVAALEDEVKNLKAVAKAEEAVLEAKAAYKKDKSEENKKAFRKAKQKLAELRKEQRANGNRDVAPEDVALTPDTVDGKAEGE